MIQFSERVPVIKWHVCITTTSIYIYNEKQQAYNTLNSNGDLLTPAG